jgi:hypothetical protein
LEENPLGAHLSTKRTQTRVVQMKKIYNYLSYKTMMMHHLAFASENSSISMTLYHLINYHYYKDKAQANYFSMSHNERETLHKLLIL